MELKPGYKQTEVGVIPEDWDVRTISQSFDVKAGGDFNPSSSNSIKDDRHPYPIYSNAVTDSGLYGYCSYSVHPAGSITVTARGTLGVANFRDHQYTAIGRVLVLQQKTELDGRFFSEFINNRINFVIESTGVPQLTAPQISKYKMPFPAVPEQRAIAGALSDVDALIGALDRLIAKKSNLKQAAMQQLLIGQTRLPSFNGGWEVKRLMDVCWYQEGPGVRNYQFTKVGIKLLNGTNIIKGKVVLDTTNRYISGEEAFGCYKHFLVDDGDILIASSGVTIDKFHEKVAFASADNLPLCMNTSTIRFKTNLSEFHDKYLYFFLQSDLFKEQIGKQATGSAQLNFGPAHLRMINVKLPLLDEQIAIAAVLSDMAAEIAALEARRDKTRALKQGMMQELLTGRTRLL